VPANAKRTSTIAQASAERDRLEQRVKLLLAEIADQSKAAKAELATIRAAIATANAEFDDIAGRIVRAREEARAIMGAA